MDPITALIFVSVICVGLLVVLFIRNKELEQAHQEKEALNKELEQAHREKEALNKSVVYLRCRLKVSALRSKLEELREQARRAKRRQIWRGIAKAVFKGVLISSRIFGLPIPEIDFPFPDISDIGDLPEDFDIPDDYDFEPFFDGFENVPYLSAQELASIPLADLERYEAQLDEILQALDQTLANFDT